MAELELRRRKRLAIVPTTPAAETAEPHIPFFWPEYRDDPVGFGRHVLGLRFWHRQEELLRAIAAGDRVAVRSGQKTGKSTALVVAALWWSCTRERGLTIMTAPTSRQVKDILWKELRRIALPLAAVLGATPALSPSTGMTWEDGRQILGFTADSPEGMAGSSGAELLYLVDESSGVTDAIFEAIIGNCAGGARLVLSSNPTQTSGFFFEGFHRERAAWKLLHISSEETPNATGHGEPIPGLATRAWLDERRKSWGRDDPRYQVRALGNFPTQAERSVFGLGVVDAAKERGAEEPTVLPTDRLEFGLDVARFGDDENALYPRRGNRTFPALLMERGDGAALAAQVLHYARTLRIPGEPLPRVKVDGIGVGTTVVDHLRPHHGETIELLDVISSTVADDEEKYTNLRTQLWFAGAEYLKNGGTLPDDPVLESELLATRYTFDARGRLKVESKEDTRARLNPPRSPDRADAWLLSIYSPVGPAIPPPSKVQAPYRMASASRGF